MIEELSSEAKKVLALAREEARRYRRRKIGSENLLLALARYWTDCPPPALPPLELLAQNEPVLRARDLDKGAPDFRSDSATGFNPEARHCLALAWRFAILQQRDSPLPVDLLLGLLWDGDYWSAKLAREIGLTFHIAFSAVTGWASPPPGFEPLAPFEVNWGDRVTVAYGDHDRVLRSLKDLLPPGAPLAFNHDCRIAWFRTSAEIDLRERVQAALESDE